MSKKIVLIDLTGDSDDEEVTIVQQVRRSPLPIERPNLGIIGKAKTPLIPYAQFKQKNQRIIPDDAKISRPFKRAKTNTSATAVAAPITSSSSGSSGDYYRDIERRKRYYVEFRDIFVNVPPHLALTPQQRRDATTDRLGITQITRGQAAKVVEILETTLQKSPQARTSQEIGALKIALSGTAVRIYPRGFSDTWKDNRTEYTPAVQAFCTSTLREIRNNDVLTEEKLIVLGKIIRKLNIK